jgi:hypothetical protein
MLIVSGHLTCSPVTYSHALDVHARLDLAMFEGMDLVS